MRIDPADVTLRSLLADDVAPMRRYFFESSPEFLVGIGLKPRSAEEAREFETRMRLRLQQPEPLPTFAVDYRGSLVGFHTSTHFEPGDSLIMHAHFLNAEHRGRGIGTVSYVKAIEKFLTEFDVRKVIFKTPTQNEAPMRIKKKLGLEPVGEEIVDWPVLIRPLPTKIFEVTKENLPELKRRAGL